MRCHPIHIAGLPLIPATTEQALDMIWEDAAVSQGRVYALVNAYSATLRRTTPAYAALLAAEDTVPLADGAPLSFGARLLGFGVVSRSPGPDLLEAAVSRAARDGHMPMFFLGGDTGVVDDLCRALRSRHPLFDIAGAITPSHGDWPREESLAICEAVRQSSARLLWVGVSAPKQEIWAHDFVNELGMPIVCVGAAFDFLSGHKPRAPKWMRSSGLEWLFRLITEPRRLWKRYLIGNLVFAIDFLRFGRKVVQPPSQPSSGGSVGHA